MKSFVLLLLLALAADAADYPNVANIDFTKFPRREKRAGKTLHVAAVGQEFKSLAAALEKAGKGDTILVHKGRYALDDVLVIEKSDLSLVGEGATLVPANGEVRYALDVRGDNVSVEGFIIEGFTGSVITFGRTDRTQHNLVFADLTVKGGDDGFRSVAVEKPAQKPLLSGLLLENVWIEGSHLVGFNIGEGPVTDIRLDRVTVAMKSGRSENSGADAIGIESGDNIFINGCEITGAEADGIDTKATRVCVYDTVVHDVGRNGVKFWRGGDLVNSLVYDTGADASIVFDGAGTYRILHTIVAFHARGGSAYALTCGYDHPKDKIRLIIANSIFYKNAGPVWVSATAELDLTNSIFTGSANGIELVVGETEIANDWSKVKGARGIIMKPPKFVDEEKGDFRLQTGSPGMDGGAKVEAMPAHDRLGKPRIQGAGPDLGPLELPFAQGTSRMDGTMKNSRKLAAQRTRRIIMNNDGNDCRNPKPDEPKTTESFLSKRTAPLVGSQVDAIFYCDGVFNSYTHQSDETELRGHGDGRGVDWAWELAKQGRDALAILTDFGHQHDIEIFWSMRMNDTHDSQDKALLCKWKQDHPEYLMGKKGDLFPHAGRWSAVNYGLTEVREKVFRIFQDVCTRYDVDGIEMDFFRHPVYFKPQLNGEPVTQEHCDMMTGFLRRVRQMADEVAAKRGRPLLIAVRVPDSAGYCRAMGLDIERWMADDLIDLMAVTCYFQLNAWEESVQLGHKYGVPVYPSLSESRITGEVGKVRNSLAAYRARAMNVWHSGADGVYLFNYFNPRAPLWREAGDPKTLEKLDKVYAASFQGLRGYSDPKWWLAGGDKFAGLPRLSPDSPLTLKPGEKKTVTLTVGEDVRQAELKLRFQVEKVTVAEDVTVTLNSRALGNGTLADGWLEFRPGPDGFVKGANRIGIEGRVEMVVQDLLMWVSYGNKGA